MNTFKEKSKGFIVGILVGVIVSGGFFILKLDNYFKELNFYKSIVKSFSSESKTTEQDAKTKSLTASKANSNKLKNKKSIAIRSQASISSGDTIEKDDRLVIVDSTLKGPAGSDDIVRKDELITTKTLDVISLGVVTNKNKDSLLQKVSGIKDDNLTGKQLLNVEFWSSPLNYKGYKLSKYKVILYGFSSPDGMKLYRMEDVVYLKNAGIVYRMEYSGEFKPYEKVVDESILDKLK